VHGNRLTTISWAGRVFAQFEVAPPSTPTTPCHNPQLDLRIVGGDDDFSADYRSVEKLFQSAPPLSQPSLRGISRCRAAVRGDERF